MVVRRRRRRGPGANLSLDSVQISHLSSSNIMSADVSHWLIFDQKCAQ